MKQSLDIIGVSFSVPHTRCNSTFLVTEEDMMMIFNGFIFSLNGVDGGYTHIIPCLK